MSSIPSIPFGRDVTTGRTIELLLSLCARNWWIQGTTGSLKTVITVYICCQLMKADPTAAFLFIDLGGDQFAFNALKQQAEAFFKEFRFLSLNPADDWDSLDPMEPIAGLDDIPLAVSHISTFLGADYGEGWGRSFYLRMSLVMIADALQRLRAEGITAPTLQDFVRSSPKRGKRSSDYSEAQLAAELLLTYPQLQPSAWDHKQIHCNLALERGQVVYGFLPVLMNPGARMIAAAMVSSMVLAAMHRAQLGLTPVHVYIVVEEFHSVAAAKLWNDLAVMARKFHVSLICISQSSAQLKTKDRDLFPIMFDNTALKVWLTPLGEDIEALQSLSRDVLKNRGATKGFRSGTSSLSLHEVYEPALEANEIRDAAFTGLEGFLMINDFQGFKEPVRFRFEPEFSVAEHARLSQLPLPKRESLRSGHVAVDDAKRAMRQEALDQLFAQAVASWQWQ